jgi:hypothetical protein
MTQAENSRVGYGASILGRVSATESKFTIRRFFGGGGCEEDADNFFRDRPLGVEVLCDSGDLRAGRVGQSTLCQDFRANAGG